MKELALQLIEENKKTRAPFLDLGNCGLTKVPEEIGELVWLEELSFSNLLFVKGLNKDTKNNGPDNKILALKGRSYIDNPFRKLHNLKRIWFNCSRGRTSYSPYNLSAFRDLTKLEWLDLSNSRIRDISALSRLQNLKYLDLSNTQSLNISNIRSIEYY